MRYLLLLLLTGCMASSETIVIESEPPDTLNEVQVEFNPRTNGNGTVTTLNENSWEFIGHDNQEYTDINGRDCEKHYCKKSDANFPSAPWIANKIERHEFDFTLIRYNYTDPSFHIIIWQDWIRWQDSIDQGWAHHPMTTLDLKPVTRGTSNDVILAVHDNRWQWKYTLANPHDVDDPEDREHGHPYKRRTGFMPIVKNTTYHIEILLTHGADPEMGQVLVTIDGNVISHEFYQIRDITAAGAVQFGMYWFRFYNTDFNGCARVSRDSVPENTCKSNGVRIENYRVFEN